FLHRVVSGLLTLRIDIEIDVWTKRERNSPVSHGHFRIEIGSLLERAHSFVVIESVNKTKTLVEKTLGLGVTGGYRMMERTDSAHQSGGFLRTRHLHRVIDLLRVGNRQACEDESTH